MKYTTLEQRKRRAYQLKYRIIPAREDKVNKYGSLHKSELAKLRSDIRDLHNFEADLMEEVTENTYLETLKSVSSIGKPKNIKIPKSIGGKGQ